MLQNSFQQQLTQYKMGSLAVSDVRISPGNYEPEGRRQSRRGRLRKRSHPAALGISASGFWKSGRDRPATIPVC